MKLYAQNKKAYHDYEVQETLEAAFVIHGPEVKSIRKSNINLKGSYITLKDAKVILVGSHISKPQNIGHWQDFDEYRDRQLLINKKQYLKFSKALEQKGYTLVATKVYQPKTSSFIKVEIGLARGKNQSDKRQALKEKQSKIETQRNLKDY